MNFQLKSLLICESKPRIDFGPWENCAAKEKQLGQLGTRKVGRAILAGVDKENDNVGLGVQERGGGTNKSVHYFTFSFVLASLRWPRVVSSRSHLYAGHRFSIAAPEAVGPFLVGALQEFWILI